MNSIRYPNISSNPLVGFLAIVIILLCLSLVADIKINELFTSDGFTRIYNSQPWVIYLAIAIGFYSFLNIWKSSIFSVKSRSISNKNKREPFDPLLLMTFDDFFKKYFTTDVENESELKSAEQVSTEQVSTEHKYDPKNSFMLLRTKIFENYYYLIIKNNDESSIYSHVSQNPSHRPIMCRTCKNGDDYIRPVLIKESELEELYASYKTGMKMQISKINDTIPQGDSKLESSIEKFEEGLNNAVPTNNTSSDTEGIINVNENILNSVNNVEPVLKNITDKLVSNMTDSGGENKKLYYPRYIHHLSCEIQNKSNINSGDNGLQEKQAYTISGIHPKQISDLDDLNNLTPFLLTTNQVFSNPGIYKKEPGLAVDTGLPDNNILIQDDKLFVCASQLSTSIYGNMLSSNQSNSIFSESSAPLLDNNTKDIADSKIIFDPELVSEYKKLSSIVNLFFYNKLEKNEPEKKFYMARLNKFKPQNTDGNSNTGSPVMYPVGLIPADYKPEDKSFDKPDYSFSEKINFEVIAVKLLPIS
jgi:hypothetical protein